jgi:hypothetical protein
MSRSNPSAERQPHPAELWLEWRGSAGSFRYYDKEKEENRIVTLPFKFIVLDQLSTIRGYSKRAKQGIFANEIRDTRAERLSVRFYNGNTIADGFYGEIKDRVLVNGGHFVCNCYIAYKDGSGLKLGAIQFQGCSLGPWFEFVKVNREALLKQAVIVKDTKRNDTGEIKFIEPIFSLADVSPESDEKAKALDIKLQEYLKGYFSRTRTEQVVPPKTGEQPAAPSDERPVSEPEGGLPPESDDVPF